MTGGIDQVDLVFFPVGRDRGGGDCDAAFLFLFHKVHNGLPIVNFTDFMGYAGEEEDAFRGRSLAGINVRDDADISNFL